MILKNSYFYNYNKYNFITLIYIILHYLHSLFLLFLFFYHHILIMKTKKNYKNNKNNKNNKIFNNNITKNKYKKGGKDFPTQNNYNFELDNSLVNNNNTKISSNNTSYNDNLFVRESHNCYTYFLNLKNKDAVNLCKTDFNKHNMCRRAQPGYFSGYPNLNDNDYKCNIIMDRTMKDNPQIYKVNSIKDTCKPGFYKGAVVVAPGRDYHYYRENDDGFWSHKPGYKPTTIYDSNNNIIKDPKLAARDYGGTLNYKDFCGYTCVPRNPTKKNMAHRNYSFDNKNPFTNRKRVEKAYEKQKSILNKLKIKPTNNITQALGKRVTDFLLPKNKTVKLTGGKKKYNKGYNKKKCNTNNKTKKN